MGFYDFFSWALPYIVITLAIIATLLTIKIFFLFRRFDDNYEKAKYYKQEAESLKGQISSLKDQVRIFEQRCGNLEHKLSTYKTVAKRKNKTKTKDNND